MGVFGYFKSQAFHVDRYRNNEELLVFTNGGVHKRLQMDIVVSPSYQSRDQYSWRINWNGEKSFHLSLLERWETHTNSYEPGKVTNSDVVYDYRYVLDGTSSKCTGTSATGLALMQTTQNGVPLVPPLIQDGNRQPYSGHIPEATSADWGSEVFGSEQPITIKLYPVPN